MIELRWLKRRPVPVGEAERVLQYKVMLVRVKEPPSPEGMMDMVWIGEWSGWMDVPEEWQQKAK